MSGERASGEQAAGEEYGGGRAGATGGADPGDWERAVPDIDGEPAIADTLYAATEELEHAAPELRATADSIAEVVGPLVHDSDAAALLIGDPDPAAMLPDAEAEHLAGLLTDAAAQATSLAAVLQDAADQAEGLAAVLTDEHSTDEHSTEDHPSSDHDG
ncbi:hypothetical protein ACVBEQ_02825 [Nakamurella sp. GG22]